MRTLRKTKRRYSLSYRVRLFIFTLLLGFAVMMAGCAKPEVITQTKYEQVFIPVKCEASLPNKPNFNPDKLESAKEIAAYFKEVEEILKACIDAKQ